MRKLPGREGSLTRILSNNIFTQIALTKEIKRTNLTRNIASLRFVFELHWNRCSNKSGIGIRFEPESSFELNWNPHSNLPEYAIWNAGGLPPSLTPDLLLREHDSIPRNRKIAEAFFYAGLIERWGSGTTRMAAELETVGMPLPEFNSEPGRFRLTFYREFFTDDRLKSMGLSERQLLAVAHVKAHETISNTDYQTITGVSKRTASRELNELKLKAILVTEGVRGRGTIYRLKKS